LLLQIIGILYTLLILKESQDVIEENQQQTTSDPFNSTLEIIGSTTNEELSESVEQHEEKFSDNLEQQQQVLMKDKIFEAIRNYLIVITRQRSGRGRLIVWLLLICNFVFVGCEYEYVNEYFFVRTKLNWEALEESPFAAFGSGTAFFGNILMTTVFSKYLKMADTIIGLIASVFSAIAKLICITVSTTVMLYVARSFDMFSGVNNVANRSIVSIVVNKNEIGRVFSLMGLLENFSKLIFLPIYTNVYKQTVNTFPNAYFIVSFVGTVIITGIFGLLCCYVDTSKKELDTIDGLPTSSENAIKPNEE